MYLRIAGKPIAKKRPRFARMGKFVKTYNDQETEEGRWLWEAQQRVDKKFTGCISVEMIFLFARPKGHYGSGKNADQRKPSAPRYHTQKPDIDNLVKFALDCLNGIAFDDDKQIVLLKASKSWHNLKGEAITLINIEDINNEREAEKEAERELPDILQAAGQVASGGSERGS